MQRIYPGGVLGGDSLYLGLSLGDILYFTSDDTFDKGDYPGLRAVRFKVQAPGGGAGAAATTGASQFSAAGGGGAGAYAESLVLATDLDDSEAITVPAGGAGGTTGAGTVGATASVDTISGEVSAAGGNAGSAGTTLASTRNDSAFGGIAQGTGTGDLVIPGGSGDWGRNGGDHSATPIGRGGVGGNSVLGRGVRIATANAGGGNGAGYGAGGTGGNNNASQGTVRAGGAGAPALVIAELLY